MREMARRKTESVSGGCRRPRPKSPSSCQSYVQLTDTNNNAPTEGQGLAFGQEVSVQAALASPKNLA